MTSKDAVVFNIEFTPPIPNKNWTDAKTSKWADNRKFYSCNGGSANVANYTVDGEKVDRASNELLREQAANRLGMNLTNRLPDKSEARRIDEYVTRFNTVGAFNLNGAMTTAELDEWIDGAKTTKSNIWHGILSLPSWQSKLVGYEDMERLVRQTFGGFLKDAGFDKKNIALLAAMHENTENKHIHFTFYEKSPNYRDSKGNISYRKQGKLNKQAIIDYRMSATAYLDEQKKNLSNYRNATVNALRTVVTDKELYTALKDLSYKLPARGRLQYNASNIKPFRKDIDDVAKMLLRKNPTALSAHNNVLKEIARRGKALSETGTNSNYTKRLTEEYKSRLANVVLGMVKQFRNDPKAMLGNRAEPTRKQHKAQARRKREFGTKLIQSVLKLVNGGNKSLQADFTRELHRAERDIEYGKENAQNHIGSHQ